MIWGSSGREFGFDIFWAVPCSLTFFDGPEATQFVLPPQPAGQLFPQRSGSLTFSFRREWPFIIFSQTGALGRIFYLQFADQ